jgi:hypothetical protein
MDSRSCSMQRDMAYMAFKSWFQDLTRIFFVVGLRIYTLMTSILELYVGGLICLLVLNHWNRGKRFIQIQEKRLGNGKRE